MKRKPRDPIKGKLVTNRLISLTHGQMGIIEATGGMFVYLIIMAEQGFLPARLLNLRVLWESPGVNDLKDSYGQEWVRTRLGIFLFYQIIFRHMISEKYWNIHATRPSLLQ